jgi:hypothetical protein
MPLSVSGLGADCRVMVDSDWPSLRDQQIADQHASQVHILSSHGVGKVSMLERLVSQRHRPV